eukprot:11191766-Heterocapsa_arctica.AAC.1
MDGDDSDEDDEQTIARQTAANELDEVYNDFVPAFDVSETYDIAEEESESSDHPCDLDVDYTYDPYPPAPTRAPRA